MGKHMDEETEQTRLSKRLNLSKKKGEQRQ